MKIKALAVLAGVSAPLILSVEQFYCTDLTLDDETVAGVVNMVLDRLDASRDDT